MAGLRPRARAATERVDVRVLKTPGRARRCVVTTAARVSASVDGETSGWRACIHQGAAGAPHCRRPLSRVRQAGVLQLGQPDASALGTHGASIVEAVSELPLGTVCGPPSPEHISRGGAATSRVAAA